jgi:DNA-binding response OmpR family regulator
VIRIYVFGDRKPLIDACRFSLGRLGYVVYTPAEVVAFMEAACSQRPDLAIIDLVANGLGGLQLCREIRGDLHLRDLPVLAVATPALLSGLTPEVGFNDFLVEPFSPEEVEARVRMVRYRMRHVGADDVVEVGPLRLHLAAYQAAVDGRMMDLTHLEFELLKFLATHRGTVYTRDMLLSLVWGEDYYWGTRTVDVHIRRLRAKLSEQHANVIQTVRGVGYRFQDL